MQLKIMGLVGTIVLAAVIALFLLVSVWSMADPRKSPVAEGIRRDIIKLISIAR